MSKQIIKEYIYYGEGNDLNQPHELSASQLVYNSSASDNGSLLLSSNNNSSILQNRTVKQMGFQSLPGTKIYINQSDKPIILGQSGIFEVDLSNFANAQITSITFSEESLIKIQNNVRGFLIIDLILEGDEEEEDSII